MEQFIHDNCESRMQNSVIIPKKCDPNCWPASWPFVQKMSLLSTKCSIQPPKNSQDSRNTISLNSMMKRRILTLKYANLFFLFFKCHPFFRNLPAHRQHICYSVIFDGDVMLLLFTINSFLTFSPMNSHQVR